MTETARPKFLVPIHGEYRMLFRHKEFAKNHLGFDEENVVLIENGDVLELTEDSARVVENREIGRIFIDDGRFGEIEYETVSERRKLAYNGVVSLVVTLDKKKRTLRTKPKIKIKGVSGIDPLNGTLQGARDSITKAIEGMSKQDLSDNSQLKENLKLHLKRYIKKQTGSKPVIVPTIIEV